MKFSELAQEYNLDTNLLQEVVQDDLKIRLPKGVESELKPADVARILACDGLETADGKPFTPIIAKEFEDKHKRTIAARKAAETRKKKLADDAIELQKAEGVRLAGERKKHEEELKRRQTEDELRAAAAAEAAKAREVIENQKALEDEARRQAEEELRRRADESRRISTEFAALRAEHSASQQSARAASAASANEVTSTAAAPTEPVVIEAPVALAPSPTPAPPAAPAAPVAAISAPVSAAPISAAPISAAPTVPDAVSKLKGIGSKLASLAKATHEKGDHSIKAVPKPVAPPEVAGAAPKPDESLSPEDRRKLIQANIARNLDMAKRVQQAKLQDKRKKPGFATIDRTKTPGPARPGGPGGPRGPAGPGRGGPPKPGRGPKRDSKDHRVDADLTPEEAAKANRRFRSSLDEDISGVTEFAVSMPCTVREFSEASGVKVSIVIAKLFMAGLMANINSVLDKDAIELLAQEFKKTVSISVAKDAEEEADEQHAAIEDKDEDLAPRPPIVTIMGHVDHGKTSLLDAIKKTQVAAGEAGGITQHIGAYTVTTPSNLEVTFIDTPGHQAFTEMRARGSQVTDVAVIVVAADDGVMPQTIEAINHAKAAGVSIVVAMNKIDKPEATKETQETVIRQLAEAGLQAEEWGGDIGVVRVSALTGEGLDELLERLALETELLELKANHFANASGTVIEARRKEGQGVTATFLVQRGSLAIGDVVLAGIGYGKVRSLTNWKGERVTLAGPSTAVELIGLNDMPRAGDKFQVLDDLKVAAEAAETRLQKLRERELTAKQKTTTAASLFGDIAASKKKEVRVVIKADASGSLEVLNKTITDISTNDVRLSVIHSGVGGINASDVSLAEASKAMILGFHVIADPKARALADSHHLEIRTYTIIYELLDDLRAAATGMLDPEVRETVIGHADVRTTFNITKVGAVAGLFITDGFVRRDAYMRITRDQKILHTGKVGSLRRFKEDVKEVKMDFECGLTVEGFQDLKTGDVMEFYTKEKFARSL